MITCPLIVGREPELVALGRLLAEARAGAGHTALITGEAGVGKSRLAAWVAERAQGLGFRVLRGGCFEPDRALPYAGLLDVLRAQLGPLAPDAAAAALGPLAAHLVGLLPEYAPLLPNLAPLPALDPEQERRRATQAFVQLFAAQAARAPLLVVLEDLHWGDEATRGVLLALARRAGAWPLLLLLTSRDEQGDPGLTDMLATLGRERIAARLPLARLPFEQTDSMLRAIFSQQRPIRGDFLAALYGLTEGNPFFIEEVLGALVAAGEIFRADGRWERKPVAELHIPGSVQAAVQRRIAALQPDARRLASLAAVIGRSFDFELLRRLTASDEPALLDQLRALIAAQLIVEEAPDRFAFRHALIGVALAAELLTRERRALHAEIGAARETIAREGGPEVLEAAAPELARHFYEAGAWAPALHYARQAAERAQRLYAPSAAVEQLTRALASARALGPPPSELLRARGSMHETLGAAQAALDDYREALARARERGDRLEEWRTLLAIGFLYAARDYATMGEYLRQALELARTLGDPVVLGQSLNRYGNWHLFLEQPGEALRYHGEALALFAAANDRAGLAATHDLLGVTQIMGADKPAAAEHYRRAIGLFRELGDLIGLASALATFALRGISYYHTTTAPVEDGYAAWVGDGEEALGIARQIGWRAGEANALVYLALVHGAAGDYGPALARAGAAWELAREIEHPVWVAGATMARGALALDLLDLPAARAELEQALSIARGLGPFFTRRVVGYLTLTYLGLGDRDRAAATLAELLDEVTPMETQGQRIDWLARAELALADGEPQRALAIAEGLIATATHAAERGAGCIPALWRLQGECLAALGRAEAAEEALRAAATGAARLGLLPTRWRTLRSLGRLYQATGRRTLARGAFAEAYAAVQLLAGRVPDRELRERYLRATAALLPSSARAAHAQGHAPAAAQLTRREREVAALVAQGRTSREIAAALVLGERTVETHISNILGKLGLSTRRAIAAWAIEAGLARRVE